LIEEPTRLIPPPGLVYSTNPQHARATDGHTYVLKGPDPKVVFPEAVCYELAGLLNLSVPACGLCNIPGREGAFFASRELRTRTAIEGFIHRGKVVNAELLAQAVAFDVWIANIDRNAGNIVGEPQASNGTGLLKLFAIDFEKSQILAGVDRFTVTALPLERFWPTGVLGQVCGRQPIPADFCARIARMSGEDIGAILHATIWDLSMPEVPWIDSAVDVLTHRANRISALVTEVWS
jgi:hypothetical protein